MAIYNISQIIGVNAIIKNTDNNWNRNEELRALASFTTRIKIANRNKKIVNAVINRIVPRIELINHSSDEKESQTISIKSQLHIVFIATWANSQVSMLL
jgi:hypothetical protein